MRFQRREVGDKVLLMDRRNGKWALRAATQAGLLDESDDLSAPDRAAGEADIAAAALRSSLRAAGIGGPVIPPPSALNTLILKLTKLCNYACTYCYDLEHDDVLVNLSLEVAHAPVDESLHLPKRCAPDVPDLLVILSCNVGAALPETAPLNPYCEWSTELEARITALAAYLVPKADVSVSATFRSDQGQPLEANRAFSTAESPRPWAGRCRAARGMRRST